MSRIEFLQDDSNKSRVGPICNLGTRIHIMCIPLAKLGIFKWLDTAAQFCLSLLQDNFILLFY